MKKWFSVPNVTKIVPDDPVLVTFNKVIKDEIWNALEVASEKAKKIHYEKFHICSKECKVTELQNFWFNKIKEIIEKVSVTGYLFLEWEHNIYELTNQSKIRDKFVNILENQMRETKDQYYETMRDMAICQTIAIKCENVYNQDMFITSSFKEMEELCFSRTMFTTKFSRNRCAVTKQYYLSHRLIKNIVVKAHLLLPEIFCDFGHYHSVEFIDFDKFIVSVETNLRKSAHNIIAYYSEIVQSFSQRRYIQDIPMNALIRFLKCATTLLGLQIITRATHTIKHLLNVLDDQTTIPLLKLDLKCESNDLFMSPRLEEFYDAFHNLVDKIANIAHHLPPLESWIHPKEWRRLEGCTAEIIRNDYTMFASPPAWYLNEVHQHLNVILQKSFRPLSDYLEKLRLQFSYVFDKTDQVYRDTTPEKELSFDKCVAKVEDFNQLVRVINGMPNNEYLTIIRLRQITAKSNLIVYANKQRERVIDNLVTQHWNYNLEICAIFEMMKERVLNIPRTTKELIELGQYMLTATSALMMDLQDKIILSVCMMSSLIGMTTLGKHHIELNNTTIQWLRRIKPIIERSSALYEQMKFDLEEKLQEEVAILNVCVEEMFPRLIIMNNMDDVKLIKEYIEDVRKMVRQLERMEQKAKWINAEEALFQFPLTLYPRIKELREHISPFYNLIYRGYQWQRDRGIWLDGPFEYLDVQHIENKLNQYLSDFTKINKQYKTRIKMQLAINYPYSFAGLVDDPDPFQQPAPLKLCHQLIEDVKWFKQYVPLLSVFRNSAMRQIHWDNMSVITGYDVTPDAGTTLKKIISLNLTVDLKKNTGATVELD